MTHRPVEEYNGSRNEGDGRFSPAPKRRVVMAKQASIQQDVVVDELNPDLKQQLAEYVAEQPASRQAMHRWMNWTIIVSMAVPVGLFIRALYLSIIWKRIDPIQIPVAWFLFMAGGTLPILLTGLHAVLLRAFPPIPPIGAKFVTGSKAVWSGGGMMVIALLIAALWGLFAYSVWAQNMAMVQVMVDILTAVIGVGVTVAIVFSLYQKLSRKL
jgi:hypothetical protein